MNEQNLIDRFLIASQNLVKFSLASHKSEHTPAITAEFGALWVEVVNSTNEAIRKNVSLEFASIDEHLVAQTTPESRKWIEEMIDGWTSRNREAALRLDSLEIIQGN